MSDVSCRIVDSVLAFAEHRGVSLARFRSLLPLDEGGGRRLSEAVLRDPRQRVAWNTYVRIMDATGLFDDLDPTVIDDYVTFSLKESRGWVAVAAPLVRLIADARRFYLSLYHLGSSALFANVDASMDELPDGRIRLVLALAPEYDDCPAFFEISQRTLARMPTVAGFPAGLVRLERSPRRGVFDITPPMTESLFGRLWSSLRVIFGSRTAIKELAAQHQAMLTQYNETLRSEAELRRLRVQLEMRVEERTRQLEQAEDRAASFGEILDGCQAEIYILDPKTLRFLKANLGAARATGYTQEELQTMGPLDIAVNTQRIPSRITALQQQESLRYRSQHRRRNGEVYPIDLFLQRSTFEGRDVIVCIADDITPRVKAEEERNRLMAEMLAGQHLQTIGTLAGGLAHEFNNILTPILAHTALIAREVPDDGRGKSSVERIEKAVLRGRDLVKQILDMSRPSKFEPQAVRLDEIAAEVAALMRPSLPRGVALVESGRCAEARVWANPVQLHQVILNLVTNAVHAVEAVGVKSMRADGRGSGGRIEVTVDVDQQAPPARRVRLVVKDDGAGMDEATQRRAFEPFFTTKAPGKGTGLGLSIIRDIVERHGGEVSVVSAPGEGAAFTVAFPAASEKVEDVGTGTGSGTGSASVASIAARPRILLVDDEAEIAHVLAELLTEIGYEVVAFTSAAEALERLATDRAFSLLLSDLTMPGMTGLGLARAVRQQELQLPICLLTGFNHNINRDECERLGVRRVFEKPIEPAQFLAELAAVLRSS